MGKRGGKRPRLGSKNISHLPRKVGIVSHSSSDEKKGSRYEVKLYVVDVDQPNILNTVATPVVRFVFPDRRCIHAVCVLKSTVYIIWGYNPFPRPFRPPDVRSKLARKFSLSNGVVNLEVKKKQLDRITPMNFPKAFPVALPTPNGQKILVFSAHIVLKDTSGAFELYDPASCTWETLPGLPSYSFLNCCLGRDPHSPCSCYSAIRCYSFRGEFRFYVEYKAGAFILDLKEKTWKSLGIWIVPSKHYLSNFVTANKGRYALTAEGKVYPWNGSLSIFPLSRFPPPNTPYYMQQFNTPSIVSLGEDEEVCETCILQIETNDEDEEESNARLLLDVCRTELKEPFTSTTVSNTVSLQIDFLEDLYAIFLISL